MKVTIFLIAGFLAVSAEIHINLNPLQLPSFESNTIQEEPLWLHILPKNPLKVIEIIIHHSSKTIETDRLSIDLHLDNIITKTQNILINSNQDIEELIHKANQTIDIGKYNKSECFTEISWRLQQISYDSIQYTKTCYGSFIGRINDLRISVTEHIYSFVGKINEIQRIMETCTTNQTGLVSQVKCLLHHIDDIIRIVSKIGMDSKELIVSILQEVALLSKNTEHCLLTVVEQSRKDLNLLLTDVYKCLHHEKLSSAS
ncbi:uncharacterized protein LOC131431037 [Malaya genurostris]|uniref:uncharacterized protein LOC131431037 n=1 Tax=Malaya genurostris TaxID=325434 RepID=UPI0026F40154|nr:uncharacterized protein LOC131431037 [Malaya genurostris]